MKFFPKFVLFYMSFLLLGVLSSACRDALTYYYKVSAVSVSKLEYLGNFYYGPTQKEIFAPDTFGINLRLSGQVLVADNWTSNTLFPSAYAFTEASDDYILWDKIQNISVTAENDFDATHPAGSDLTDYFKTVDAGSFIPINDKLNGPNGLNADQYERTGIDQDLAIFLRKSPASASIQRFVVNVTFLSGRSLSATTEAVTIE